MRTMASQTIPQPVQYIVAENGERVGVVLAWDAYQALQAAFPADPDLLVGLDKTELKLLAEGMLASPKQERLAQLLQANQAGQLGAGEEQELDELLEEIDLLSALKARARYTLQQKASSAS
jgi:hypothetical protein